jgi:hypothetical protein
VYIETKLSRRLCCPIVHFSVMRSVNILSVTIVDATPYPVACTGSCLTHTSYFDRFMSFSSSTCHVFVEGLSCFFAFSIYFVIIRNATHICKESNLYNYTKEILYLRPCRKLCYIMKHRTGITYVSVAILCRGKDLQPNNPTLLTVTFRYSRE